MALRKVTKNQTALCCPSCLTIIDLNGQKIGNAGNDEGQAILRNIN